MTWNFLNLFLKIFILINVFILAETKDAEESRSIKVSIVIPTYNAAPFLERCINSALNQTLQEIEVIVVNDKSTDNTEEILKKYDGEKKFKSVTLEKNQGQSVARNTGIEMAHGEFIGFIDSDDLVDLDFFENLYKLSKDKDVVIGIFVNSTNDTNKFSHHRKLYKYGCVGNSIWRKSFLDEKKIRFEKGVKMAEDVHFRERAYKSKPRRIEAPDVGSYYYYKKTMEENDKINKTKEENDKTKEENNKTNEDNNKTKEENNKTNEDNNKTKEENNKTNEENNKTNEENNKMNKTKEENNKINEENNKIKEENNKTSEKNNKINKTKEENNKTKEENDKTKEENDKMNITKEENNKTKEENDKTKEENDKMNITKEKNVTINKIKEKNVKNLNGFNSLNESKEENDKNLNGFVSLMNFIKNHIKAIAVFIISSILFLAIVIFFVRHHYNKQIKKYVSLKENCLDRNDNAGLIYKSVNIV